MMARLKGGRKDGQTVQILEAPFTPQGGSELKKTQENYGIFLKI